MNNFGIEVKQNKDVEAQMFLISNNFLAIKRNQDVGISHQFYKTFVLLKYQKYLLRCSGIGYFMRISYKELKRTLLPIRLHKI